VSARRCASSWAGWGLDNGLLDGVTDAVTHDPDRWVRFMMQLEHGF
jgi:hypothetical protein